MQTTKQRNVLLDILKGITIILVVLGHSIQFGSGSNYLQYSAFYKNELFKLIYSFHMPLFMLISGFLFYYTVNNHTWTENIKSRFTTLLLPIVLWTLIPFGSSVAKTDEYSAYALIKLYQYSLLGNLWFLWAVFYCSIVVIVVKRFFKDYIVLYLAGFLLTFFVTDIYGLSLYKFMYPFFITGYLFNRESQKRTIKMTKSVYLIGSGAAFFFLLLFYRVNSYIYTTGYYILNKAPLQQFGIDLYRMTIGFCGSIFVILLVNASYQKLPTALNKCLVDLGKNSLGIYILSGYLFYIMPIITHHLTGIQYAFTIVEAGSILFLAYFGTVALKKVKLLNVLLLGGRK